MKTLLVPPPPQRQSSTRDADITDLPSKKSSVTQPVILDNEGLHENGSIVRKEEVSAEVPKFGVSGESHRASDFETPTFEKDEA
jgi:hypothetical protein